MTSSLSVLRLPSEIFVFLVRSGAVGQGWELFFQLYKIHSSRPPISAYCAVWHQDDHRDDMESDEWADVDGGRLNYICDGDGLADANVRRTLGCNLQRPLPSFRLPPLRDDNDVMEKLVVSALSLRRCQLPVSAPMMDSAPMPHSFLLDRYVNPLWSAASLSWATKLIYESISGASGQMGPFQSPSRFVSSQSELQWYMWF